MEISQMVPMRLQNQQLTHTQFQKPEELVSWLGGVQGQDYPGAKWAVGLRLGDGTDADLERAISQKKILRTWLMRGTLHLVAAEDIRWMLKLLAPKIIKNNRRRYQELKLNDDTLKHSNQVLKEALNDGKEFNRKELIAILQKNGISTEGQRAAFMLQRASLEGLICQCGMYQNNNPIFTSLESIPETDSEHDYGLAELARRYFTSRGPATISDFIWWSGLRAADARAGLDAIKPEFISQTTSGRTYWYTQTQPIIQDNLPVVHLLPTYDEYLFGYKDRSASIKSIGKIKLKNRYLQTIALNGEIIGTWRRTFKKDGVIIEYQLFKKLHQNEYEALNQGKLNYGKFLNMTVKS